MAKYEFVILSKPTYAELVSDAAKLGEKGWEPFQFEGSVPSAGGGTTLALFFRRYTPSADTIVQDAQALPAPAPLTNAIPSPPELEIAPEPLPAPTAAAVVGAVGADHPLVRAGVPPQLVEEINLIAQIRNADPKQLVMEAIMGYVRVSWEALEQNGMVETRADGTRHATQPQ